MDKSMEGNFQTVWVEDGAECTLEIENENTGIWDPRLPVTPEPIWYLNYIIYHDKAMRVIIDEGFSFEEGTKHFMRVQDCFLDTIFSYSYDFQNIDYSDLMRKYNWIVEHDAGNQPCSSDFSMERYALSIMNMASMNLTSKASNDSKLWMNDDMHCIWPSVECKQGLVVGLDLTDVDGISGYIIPIEIGILTNLEESKLYTTGLIGSIPTEVGLLTELTSLELCKQLFSVLLVSFETKQIHSFSASNLFSLLLSHIILIASNKLTGSIPTEVGLLTELTSLGLCKQLFSVLIVCMLRDKTDSFVLCF